MPGFNFAAAARESPGFHFGKFDLERLGVFTDPGYLRMVNAKPKKTAPPKLNNPPMVLPGPKIKCGLGDGYFDPEFRRIFINEGITWRVKKTKAKKDDGLFGPIIPVGATKQHSTPGDSYGCFAKYTAMDNRSKPVKQKKDKDKKGAPPNCQIAYPGYFSKFPEYKPEGVPKKKKPPKIFTLSVMIRGSHGKPYFWENPYKEPKEPRKAIYVQPKKNKNAPKRLGGPWIPVGPGKLLEGCKGGGFERWPVYKPVLLRKVKKDTKEYSYRPQSYGAKSIFTPSIVNMCVDISTNVKTQATMQPKHVTRYLIPTV